MSDRMNDSARPFQRSVTASGMNRDRGSIEPNYYEGTAVVKERFARCRQLALKR